SARPRAPAPAVLHLPRYDAQAYRPTRPRFAGQARADQGHGPVQDQDVRRANHRVAERRFRAGGTAVRGRTLAAEIMPGPIVVIGSINMDLVCRTRELPAPGETVLGGAFLTIPGGKGANQAVAAARLARRGID